MPQETAYLWSKYKNSIHQVQEDDWERHDQEEEETYIGTLDVCVLQKMSRKAGTTCVRSRRAKSEGRQRHD